VKYGGIERGGASVLGPGDTQEEMKKKEEEDKWMTIPIPTTPLQRNSYIDACTAWIVKGSHVEVVPPPHFLRTGRIASHQEESLEKLSFSKDEADRMARRACAFCKRKGKDTTVMVANPYSERCYTSVCARCKSTSSKDGSRQEKRTKKKGKD